MNTLACRRSGLTTTEVMVTSSTRGSFTSVRMICASAWRTDSSVRRAREYDFTLSLLLAGDLDGLVGLDDVALLEVLEVLDADAAFIAGLDRLRVVLESTE